MATNANVKFLRGQSSRFSASDFKAADGCIYLTEDTHKLYAGIKRSGSDAIDLALLNHDITFVNKVSDLKVDTSNRDQLYYAKNENVLAIFNAVTGKFEQINPDDGATSVTFEGAEDGNALVGARYDAETRAIVFTKGKLTAKDIKTTDQITVTTPVGNYAKGDKIDVSDIETILLNMLCQDSDPSANAPSAGITLKNSSTKISSDTAYEVGSTINPVFEVANNVGSYTANGKSQASGVTVLSSTVTENGRPGASTPATADGKTVTSFPSFTVGDGTTYYLSISTSFSDGVVPTTFLGKTNAKCEEVQIKAQTKTGSSKKITGYRAVFYGYKDAASMIDIDNITSDQIRALSHGQTMTTSLNTNKMQQMIFAFPESWGVKSVSAVGEPAPRNIKKLDHTVNVEGVGGYEAKPYNVFYCTEGSANGGAEKFTITYSTTA